MAECDNDGRAIILPMIVLGPSFEGDGPTRCDRADTKLPRSEPPAPPAQVAARDGGSGYSAGSLALRPETRDDGDRWWCFERALVAVVAFDAFDAFEARVSPCSDGTV